MAEKYRLHDLPCALKTTYLFPAFIALLFMAYTRDTSAQDRLSGTEQQIVAAVEAHKNAAIDFFGTHRKYE